MKIFVMDIDEVLVQELFPNAEWLIRYRGVIFIGIAAVLAAFAWGSKLLGSAVYVALYPILLVCWYLPAWLIRRRAWTLSIALAASVVAGARSLRAAVVLLGMFSVGALLVLTNWSDPSVLTGMALLGVSLLAVYSRAILDAFRPSADMFTSRTLDKIWGVVSAGFTPSDELKGVDTDAMTDAQQTQWVSNLQFSILYGRLCYFVADKLRVLSQGRVTAAIASLRVSWLFAAAVTVFAFLNLGLYEIDSAQFEVARNVRPFDFFWYAFQASFLSTIPEIVPVGTTARTLFMLNELATGLVLLVIVVSFVTVIQAAKNQERMDALIERIQDHGRGTESFVSVHFGLTVTAAMEQLVRFQAGMLSWILSLSPELETTDEEGPGPNNS